MESNMDIRRGVDIYFQPNIKIGERYHLSELIKHNSTHFIWKASDELKNRQTVVIKFFVAESIPANDEWIKYWENQFHQLQKLTNPSLLLPISSGVYFDFPFWVYPYIPNGSLETLKKPLTPQQLLSFLYQIAQTLDFLHSQNLFHLDITLDNLYWKEENRFLLGDLGLTSSLLIKPAYIPPEWNQEPSIKNRAPTDIFSLGVCGFYLATLTFPSGEKQENLRQLNQNQVPTPLSQLILNCISPNFNERPLLAELLLQLKALKTSKNRKNYWINLFAISAISIASILGLWIILHNYTKSKNTADSSSKYDILYQRYLINIEDNQFAEAALLITEASKQKNESLEEQIEVCIQLVKKWMAPKKNFCNKSIRITVRNWMKYQGLISVLKKEHKNRVRQYLNTRNYPITYTQFEEMLIKWLDCLIAQKFIREAGLLLEKLEDLAINPYELKIRKKELSSLK
jgi:serine/threonine protein kinase